MKIKEAREILAEEAEGLTDVEIQEILDWLDKMVYIAIEVAEKSNKK